MPCTIMRSLAVGLSALVLVVSQATGAPHHAAVPHHGLVCRDHTPLGKLTHLCGVILQCFDGSRVGRGLNYDDSVQGDLIRTFDLVLVSEDRV